MNTKLQISKIDRSDTTFQFRVTTATDNITDLARLISDGYEMDPIEVRMKENGLYQIIDGFQRTEAYFRVHGEKAEVPARILKLSEKQAALRAAEANQKYRAKLSKEDRANIIKELLFRFPEYTNPRIAKICKLSEGTIRNHRKKYPEFQTDEREGLDGKTRKLPSTSKALKASISEAEPTISPKAASEKENEIASKPPKGDDISQGPIESPQNKEESPEAVVPPSEESPVWHDISLAETSGMLRDMLEDMEMYANVLENFALMEALGSDEEAIRDNILRWAEQILPRQEPS
tara:strand:+ start:6733 stop:7608 length:876 start_codon:yes stop_codon:yes gene_type:complete